MRSGVNEASASARGAIASLDVMELRCWIASARWTHSSDSSLTRCTKA